MNREGTHHLMTPSRSRKGSRGEAGPNRSRTRSRSSRTCSRARELELYQERIQRLEQELQQEREMVRRRERSTRRPSAERPLATSLRAATEVRRSDDARHAKVNHERRATHIRSRSPSFSTNDVVKIIQSIKHGPESQTLPQNTPMINKNIDHKNILPNFDPSVKNQRIDVWLKKVNECASVYGWDDRTTIHFSLQKLQGLAKLWFESLDTILYTWQEWQDKLINAFPHELNYGQCLEDMLRRKSKLNEPIEQYYYEKLSLLNLCGISGKRAVDCIIHGISDRTMKSSALALRCSLPENLLQFLMSWDTDQLINDQSHLRNKNASDTESNSKKNSGQGIYCFNCKQQGHPYLQCPKPLDKCNKCGKIGHKTETCFNQEEGSSIGLVVSKNN
ncbi:uncharacterized protein LOC119629946 [Bombyx mori]|uniref:CCHC-type domain-containing protein n=1 Tax=Bombyx mori TaxID=7091 RepID=A0A8R2R7A5_BOMMO|nr:uncharacterized protein LOC119629946 [Bombyx mori]